MSAGREVVKPAGMEWQSPVEALMERHKWSGGYFCGCGYDINSPQTWSSHVLREAQGELARLGQEGVVVDFVQWIASNAAYNGSPSEASRRRRRRSATSSQASTKPEPRPSRD